MTQRKPAMRRRLRLHSSRPDKIRATLALGAVLGLGSVGTLAAWSDSATAKSGLFSASVSDVVDIKLDGADSRDFVELSMSDMVPGSTREATLVVSNAGTVDVTYTMNAVVSGDDQLGQYLRVSVFEGACGGTQLALPTQMRSSQSPVPMIDTARPLAAASGQESLCFRAALDDALWDEANWGPAQAIEGESLSSAFVFTATEVP